ncbi:MAG: cytochrome c biogenesis protein ResB, partial [Planctomycetota bacterium]|nr:cytochrome c biogenesis protein ResB [Planctomycetota bacterium]
GVVLLHGGIGLLMFSEILVGISAEEAQMHIKEGETVNYLQDIREVELAVVDQSAPDKDTTTAIPQSRLMEPFEDTIHPFFSRSFCRKMPESLRSIFQCKKGDPLITSDELPFDVVVVDYLQNSRMGPVGGTDGKVENPATKGLGLTTQATRITASTGVKSEAVDDTSVYVEFRKKGTSESLGVYLFNMLATRFQDSRARSGWTDAEIRANTPPFLYELSKPQLLEVDGKKYDVALRFKRAYKPFSVQLTDVRFDKYIGTNTAKNYSSDVVLTDGGMSVQRHIWMNNPLRYGGETFYQSNYMQDPLTGQEATGLQVVTNTGWMIPYVSCMIVAVGMLFQFGLTLFRFLGRSARGRAVDSPADTISGKPVAQTAEPVLLPTRPGTADWILAGLAVLACVAMVIGEGFGRKTGFGDFDLEQAAKIPVVYEGRIKPIDSLARNTMQVISNHDNVPDTGSTKLTAIRWLFDVMSGASDQKDGTPRSEFHKVFRIDNPEMADFFQLEWRKSHLYSRREIAKQADRFHAEVDRLREKRGNEKEIALRTEVAKAIASEVTKDAVGDIPDAKVAGNSTEIASEIASEIENAKGNVDARLIAKLIARVIVRTDVKADAKVIAQEIARVNQKAIAKAGAGAVAGAIDREYAAAQQNFDAFERKMLDLDRRIRAYTAVEASMAVKQFPANPDAELIEAFRAQAPRVRAMVESNEQKLMKGLPPLAVPMVSSDGKHDLVEWKPLVTATERDYILAKILKQQDPSRAVALWNEILTSYAEEKPQVFNRAVRSYLDLIADTRPAEYQPAKTGFEAFYNRVAPFKIAWTLYLLAGIGTLIGWLMAVAGVGRPVQWATFIGLLVIFVLHTASLMGRMYISGRPPVTNLYSSAV